MLLDLWRRVFFAWRGSAASSPVHMSTVPVWRRTVRWTSPTRNWRSLKCRCTLSAQFLALLSSLYWYHRYLKFSDSSSGSSFWWHSIAATLLSRPVYLIAHLIVRLGPSTKRSDKVRLFAAESLSPQGSYLWFMFCLVMMARYLDRTSSILFFIQIVLTRCMWCRSFLVSIGRTSTPMPG
jgi:hypothetical protein